MLKSQNYAGIIGLGLLWSQWVTLIRMWVVPDCCQQLSRRILLIESVSVTYWRHGTSICVLREGLRKRHIYIKYTYSYYGTYLLFSMCYTKSVNFIEFLMESSMCDEVFVTIHIKDENLSSFGSIKFGQILCLDKTGFLRPGHICSYLVQLYMVRLCTSQLMCDADSLAIAIATHIMLIFFSSKSREKKNSYIKLQ